MAGYYSSSQILERLMLKPLPFRQVSLVPNIEAYFMFPELKA